MVREAGAVTRETRPGAKAVVGTLATDLTLYPIAFATSLLVARVLGPDDRGTLTFLRLLGAFVVPLLSFGMPAAIRYLVSRGEHRASDVVSTVLAGSWMLGLGVSLALWAVWRTGWLGAAANSTDESLMKVALLGLPFVAVAANVGSIFLGDSRFSVSNSIALGTAAANAVLLMTFVVLWRGGLRAAVYCQVGMQAAGAAVHVGYALWKYRPKWTWNWRFITASARYGAQVWIGSVATTAMARSDQFIVGALGGARDLGFYSIAVTLAEMVEKGSNATSPVLFNRIAALRDPAAQRELTEQMHRFLLLASGLIGIMAMGMAPVLLPIVLGRRFDGAILPFLLYVPGVVMFTTPKVLSKFFGAGGRPAYGSYVQTAATAVALPAFAFGARYFGGAGAAAANTGSVIVAIAVSYWLYARMIRPHRPRLFAVAPRDLIWGIRRIQKAVADLLRRKGCPFGSDA